MLDIEIVKQQCKVEHDDDNALLSVYTQAAAGHVEAYTGRTLFKDADCVAEGVDALVLNAAVSVAMLLLIAHWYENREAVVVGTITATLPLAVQSLLQPHKIYGV